MKGSEKDLWGVFSSEKEFYKKLGVYLKEITGLNCKFKVEQINSDFIVLKIYSPNNLHKGIKIRNFLAFFDKEYSGGGVEKSERSEDGEDVPSDPPVLWGGGGGG